MSDLICPISLDLLEDPIILPCCGRAISRLALIQSIEFNLTCPLCRHDLQNVNISAIPTCVNLAYLVEEARKTTILPTLKEEEILDGWKGIITLLKDEHSMSRRKIAQLELSNTKAIYKTLLIPVIDRSGSMSGKPISQVRYSLKRILDLTYDHSNLVTFVVTYDDREQTYELNTSTPRAHFDGIFSRIECGGGTSFKVAFKEIARISSLYADVKDVASMSIIFLTDGEDSSVKKEDRFKLVQSLQEDIKKVWKKDFIIHSVGFGGNHDYSFLNSLRLIGTQEGAYRYADPSEDDDILSNKINSILDVISTSTSLPIKLLSLDLEVISGNNGKFWIRPLSKWDQNNPSSIIFSLDNTEPITIVPEVKESMELWPLWYSKLVDDIASELLMLANAVIDIDRELHIELLTRRSNAILVRLEPSSLDHARLSSLMKTLESLKRGEKIDELKLNDIRFEGQFTTKTSAKITGSSAHVSTPGTNSLVQKKTSWPILDTKKTKRYNGSANKPEIFVISGRYTNAYVVDWINNNPEKIPTVDQNGSTCLHAIASIGRVPLAKAILQKNIINVNEVDRVGYTALDLSVIYGYWKMFDLIMEYGGKLTLDGQLIFRTCISRGYTELAGRLLKHSFAIVTEDMLENVPTAEGLNWLSVHSDKDLPIEMAIQKGALDIVRDKIATVSEMSWSKLYDIFTKSSQDYINVVKIILDLKKAKANEIIKIGDEITFPLFVACEKGSLPMVTLLLGYLSQEDINQSNDKGTTCLWIASCNRHTDIVYTLIQNGANPNIPNLKGDSALICACQKGAETIVNLLLEAGIDPYLCNPLRDNPVLICCRTGQYKILEILLKRMSKDILNKYAEIDGFPPLLAATELNKVECIRVCISFGADINWTTQEDNPIIAGANALHLACHYGRVEAAHTLCELGANVLVKTKVGGYTPLHVAIRSGHSSLVRYLLSKDKSALNVIDNDGRLPEYYASMQGREDIREEFFTNKLAIIFERILMDKESCVGDILMKYGQSLGCYDFEEINMGQGSTLLSSALIHRNTNLVNALCDMGASFDVKDDYGITPDFWRSYLYGDRADCITTQEQINNIGLIAQKSIQNKMLMDLSRPVERYNPVKQIEFRQKMTDGYAVKIHKSILAKIRNASEPAILGFLDKLKSTPFPEGKGSLDQILWESRIHTVKILASDVLSTRYISPIHIMAMYLYTSNYTVFTQVNVALTNYSSNKHGNIWDPLVVCLYQAISLLPQLECEVYRGVDCTFEPELYTVGTKITWSTFTIGSTDWRSSSELIKDKRGIIFVIKSKTGRDVSRYSRNPVDCEVIFLPSCTFTITALYRADVIALGQANIRTSTFAIRDSDLKKAAERSSAIIVEIQECV